MLIVINLLEAALLVVELPEIRFALRSLDRGALCEVNDIEDAVLCTIATEELLMGLSTSDLTATFGRRVGVTITADPGLASRGEAAGRELYAARSHFLHRQSREPPAALYNALRLGRPVLVRAVLCVLNAITRGLATFGPELNAFLDDAAHVPESRRLLHKGLPDADVLE
jgi:hypothetical protein